MVGRCFTGLSYVAAPVQAWQALAFQLTSNA